MFKFNFSIIDADTSENLSVIISTDDSNKDKVTQEELKCFCNFLVHVWRKCYESHKREVEVRNMRFGIPIKYQPFSITRFRQLNNGVYLFGLVSHVLD
ncbi:MAG: hypothetical protein EHM58_16535 [Ignavibacteriae bacterium]|nr:MAG: hypothetical protein EHM58_16535 [Ignavibacteriota bacterium]